LLIYQFYILKIDSSYVILKAKPAKYIHGSARGGTYGLFCFYQFIVFLPASLLTSVTKYGIRHAAHIEL